MKKLFFLLLFFFIIFSISTELLFINTKPMYKEVNTSSKVSIYLNNIYILVNKSIYLPSDYIPDNLVRIDSTYSDRDIYLVKEVNDNLREMINDLRKENLDIRVISGYRSYKYQMNLYEGYVKKDGKEKADTYSAKPGYSEHQTGLSIDIDNRKINYEEFGTTKEYTWMINNSYKYGFILRYPEGKENITGYNYESWHFRYVGKKIAKYIYEHDITFDEYFYEFIQK